MQGITRIPFPPCLYAFFLLVISLPRLVPGCSCVDCGQLHEEDASELAHTLTDWADRVTVGPALRQLGGLQSLVVDMQGENEGVGAGREGRWRGGKPDSRACAEGPGWVPACAPRRPAISCLHHPSWRLLHYSPPLPQINSALNKLDLGPAPGLSSLTSLSLLNCHLAAGPSLLQHFNLLPALRRLEALFEGFSYFTSMPLGGTDKAGRAVTARLAAGRRWELVRELPMIEE